MKNYELVRKTILKVPMKVVNYDFKVQKTNKPTKYIRIVVHHTGKNKTLQQIIKQHIETNRWTAIGYHFMIGKKGQVYYSRDLKLAGAHTFGYNRNSIGIALFGDFDMYDPTEKQIESLKKLINGLSLKFTIREIIGHNEGIYKQIRDKYWKAELPEKDFLSIETKEEFENFQKEITTKVLKTDASKITVDLLSKITTCPGINAYKDLKNIKNTFKEHYSAISSEK